VTYRWLTDLDQALTAGGVAFLEVPFSPADPTGAASWHTRGRPGSTGEFDPQGVLCHHTASPEGCDAATDLRVVLAGNGSAPGPVSSLYIGRDAVCYLVAAGRCNHGGGGIRPGIDSACSDMNARLLGIEVGNNGVGERWGDALTDLYAAVVAALCDWYGWPNDAVYLHGQTGPPSGGCNSKIDPAGPWQRQPELVGSTMWDVDVWRQFVAEQLPAGPTPPPPRGDLMLTLFQCTDAWGCFLGFSVGGVGQLVEWTDGATKALYESLGAQVQAITVEQCSGFTLMGPLPQGDQLHTWTGGEFRRVLT
jgi:hypothetical protein